MKIQIICLLIGCAWASQSFGRTFTTFERQSLDFAMDWSDHISDPENGFLVFSEEGDHGHFVRESVWYATGLLQRHQKGDIGKALEILEWTADHQFLHTGDIAFGTFPELMESPTPPPKGKIWQDYDPNWRQFIGTNFIVLLEDFKTEIPPELQQKLLGTLEPAIEGEKLEKRLEPSYSNIALMHAFLVNWTGHAVHNGKLEQEGEDFAKQVYDIFKKNDVFLEYNSPTYYGVDLYALSLWRSRAPSAKMREWGREMEETLWLDLAKYYSPTLKNISGPFTRSYGMDATKYANLAGLYLVQVIGRNQAPFPKPGGTLNHALDLPWAPLFVEVGTKVPARAVKMFTHFSGPHQVTKKIRDNPEHVVSAWIDDKLIIGGETSSHGKAAGEQHGQYVPATVHWQLPNKQIGWIKLAESPKVDATVTKENLSISSEPGNFHFKIFAPGVSLEQISLNQWNLPGLKLEVKTDGKSISWLPSAEMIDVYINGASTISFRKLR